MILHKNIDMPRLPGGIAAIRGARTWRGGYGTYLRYRYFITHNFYWPLFCLLRIEETTKWSSESGWWRFGDDKFLIFYYSQFKPIIEGISVGSAEFSVALEGPARSEYATRFISRNMPGDIGRQTGAEKL